MTKLSRSPALLLVLAMVFSACASPRAPTPAAANPAAASQAPARPAQLSRDQQLVEGAKKEGEVALWVATIEEREKLIGLFQQRFPFLQLKVWDANSTEMMARLTEEAKVGRHTVDVLSSSLGPDAYHMGLLQEYEFPNTAGWMGQPAHKYYQTHFVSPRVVIYNTNLISPADLRSWDDVKSAKWAGKTVVSTSGWNFPLFWAYLWRESDKLNWDRSFAFWGDLFRNTRPRVGTGFTGPVANVASGEVPLLVGVATASFLRLFAKGAPIGIAPLGKAPANGVAIALVKNAPHPNAARLLIDWLTTTEGLLAYSEPTMAYLVDPKLQGKARANSLLGSLGLSIEYVPDEIQTEENLKKSTDFWQKGLGLRG